jgi:hypothetical protein
MKRYPVDGLADVGAALFQIVEKCEKAGYSEAWMIPKDLKTARYIVDGYHNNVRGRDKRSKVIFKPSASSLKFGRGDQIGPFVIGMGKPAAKSEPQSRKVASIRIKLNAGRAEKNGEQAE